MFYCWIVLALLTNLLHNFLCWKDCLRTAAEIRRRVVWRQMNQQKGRVGKSNCLQGLMIAWEVVVEGLHEHCSPELPSLHIIIELQEPQRYYHVLLIPSFLVFSFLKMQDLIVEQSSINLTKMEKIHFVDKLPLCAMSKKEKKNL